ncbi:DUF4214 domain-containing protein [Rhizobium oryzicola]|uniref:DUF4214 domain-containing protein n=1 Tax=Rhizobium oryzicola TaxID=1232668 RepID=A0ABT8T5D8_9HYPH|nr:DUF4214 domain-containing protein [Rhizobium oryzicola]MDO1585589.1 DUF4214 domain-containing protein [Rhizobium oryzicola]
MGSYELTGPKWGDPEYGTTGGQVTWSFATASWSGGYSYDYSITDPVYQQLVRDAFAAWEAVANIHFVEVADNAKTMIRLGWDAIDGAYKTVGEASWKTRTNDGYDYYLTSAEIRFDTAETWTTNKTALGNKAMNFYTVALHEIGHAIGLDHVDDKTDIMYPTTGYTTTLGEGDIEGVRELYGAQAARSFYATSGNDRFLLTSGNDVVDGGGGVDTAVFGVKRAAVTISRSGTTITAKGEGTDTLINIERLKFTDGTLAFDTAGEAGQAYRLYQAAFNRKPDAGGLGFWIGQLDADQTDLLRMSKSFIDSNEFRSTYGTPQTVSTTAFVTLVYQNVLHRAPDTSGASYWQDKLNTGYLREKLLADFSESAENQANTAAAISDGVWFV